MSKEYICPACGSINVDIHDEWFSDDGVRISCDDCGYRKYEKSFDDLDYIESKKSRRPLMERTRATRRATNKLKAIRKRNISNKYPAFKDFPWYNNLHQYSKNKIHCSCPLCASKSKNKNGYNLKISELRNSRVRSVKRQTARLKMLTKES